MQHDFSVETFTDICANEFMKIKPLNNQILVKKIEAANQTLGGIIIPDSAKSKPHHGEVIAAGQGFINNKGQHIPMTVAVGDIVYFNKYSGTEINIDGQDLLMMREDDVLAIEEKTSNA